MMIVALESAVVELLDAANFGAFHVRAPAGWSCGRIDSELRRAGAGTSDANGAAIAINWIVATAASNAEAKADWQDGFAAMLTFAVQRGWLSGDGQLILAHVEYEPFSDKAS